jgi:hypothetical protein
MKKDQSWAAILLMLSAASAGWAQSRTAPKKPPKETKSVDLKFSNKPADPFTENIVTLEKRLWEASKNADKATYAGLLASDYYEVTDLGMSGRAEALENVEGPVADYDLEDFRVTKLADNAGLVTYRASVRPGGRSQPALNVLDTELWVNRDGKWQTTFFQETSLPHNQQRQRRKR